MTDAPVITPMREACRGARHDVTFVIVQRAIARGELPEAVTIPIILETLAAPPHFRNLCVLVKSLSEQLVGYVPDGARGSADASGR